MICNRSYLHLIQYTTGGQCNCLNSGSDGENRGALNTTRDKQFCTRWSLDKSLLAVLFRREV